MSEFHQSIKSLIADVVKFVSETLKHEKLSKSAKSQKQEIIDKITKLKEDWPALATVNVISDQVKPSKDWFGTLSRWRRRSRIISWIDTTKDDEAKISGGSTNTDKGEDGYSDSSADIPTVSAMELVNYTRAGFLEKKRPGIGIGIGLKTMQKRWCVVKGNIFYYFSDKTSKKMSGAFRLIDYSFEEAPELTKDEKKKELCFKLVRPANRTFEFISLNKSDFENWRNTVMQASKVVPVQAEDDNLDGEIYDAVGEQMSDSVDTNADMYDDGQGGDIYEAEPVADIPPPVELIQDDIYDDGESEPIQEELYEDASTPILPPPAVARTARPPPPPTPDEDPYQSRPLPPMRALPKKPDEQPLPTDTQEANKENDEPQSYRNEDDFENMYIGKWDCNADNAKELSFKKGEMIYIINRDYDEKSWWIGELNGHFGLVPKNYLTMAFETLAL